MSADALITRGGPVAVPMDYTVPAAGDIQPLVVTATFNGASAGGTFVPELQIIAPTGAVIARCPVTDPIAAGASADVSWFPGVGPAPTVIPAPFTPGTWMRAAEPLLDGTQAWETGGVGEPTVRYESGVWKMWYSGNAINSAIGYAECSSADPTLTANWTKYAGNPVLGQGGSGIAGFAARSSIFKVGGTYHMFYSNAAGGSDLKHSTSADGKSWTAPTTAIVKGAGSGAIGAPGGWANSQVWFDGTSYWLFVEGSTNAGGGAPWGCWLFKNSAITNDGGWVVQNGGNGLTSLTVSGYTKGYGQGPDIAEIDGVDTFQIGAANVLWYHVQFPTGGGDTTDITHGFSTDPAFVAWSPSGVFDLIHNGGTFEQSQVADPMVLQVLGKSYMFFSGVSQVASHGYINVATYAGTLLQLLNGSQGAGTTTKVTSVDGSITVNNPTGPTADIAVAVVDGGSP